MKKLLAMLRVFGMVAVLFGSGFALTGCERNNGMEDAAEDVEDAAEDTGDEIEDALD
jgi:hypothetical protein